MLGSFRGLAVKQVGATDSFFEPHRIQCRTLAGLADQFILYGEKEI